MTKHGAALARLGTGAQVIHHTATPIATRMTTHKMTSESASSRALPGVNRIGLPSCSRRLRISYLSQRSLGPMMTPTMLCSTGVHSTPRPGAGWIAGVPVILSRVVPPALTAADDRLC
jgi:hypothetical protein